MAIVLQRELGYNTRAAGVHEGYALIIADEVLYAWADEVVCVNQEVFDSINPNLIKDKNVVVLKIPDRFPYMNQELQEICLRQYLETPVA